MSMTKRIRILLKALASILCAALMAVDPADGYLLVVLVLDITLLLYGFRLLAYYFKLARFMVGGIMTLYKSIVVIDLGLFILGLHSTPQKYVMLYLIGCLAFNGAADVLDAMGARKLGAASWKLRFSYGIMKILIAIAALFFLDSVALATCIFCAGPVYSAVSDVVSAFRKTAIVYID